MLQRTLVFALTPMMVGVWLSPETATAQSRQGHPPWLKTESRHFEIHYLPALARELDRVVRSAERAYDRISGRLHFVLATKVPLVMFAPSGQLPDDVTLEDVQYHLYVARQSSEARPTRPRGA